MSEKIMVTLNCKIASWVYPWIACTKYFIKKYGWPFEEKDIDRMRIKIFKEGVICKVLPPFDRFFGEEIKLV